MTEVMPSRPVRPDAPGWMVQAGLDTCGHCKSGHHLSCKGAVRVLLGKKTPHGVLRCYCQVCEPVLRCLDCGNQFSAEVIPQLWRCIDPVSCRGRIELRLRQSRLWRMIQECKTDSALVRRNDREDRLRIRVQVGDEPADRAISPGSRPSSGVCECCGAPTKGGKFAPGHDARLKSKLRKKSKAGDKTAYKELVERGWI